MYGRAVVAAAQAVPDSGRSLKRRRRDMRGRFATFVVVFAVAAAMPRAGSTQSANRSATEAECTAASLVATIAPSAIGEPVRSVTLQAAWVAATDTVPAHCRVDGVFAPVDTAPTAR